jgi:hypothetical protein
MSAKKRDEAMLTENGGALEGAAAEQECFRRAFESQTLKKSPAMRTLLQFLWLHRGQDLSEYSLGLDALGRRPDFNPKIDATVRVQISRLRAKLKEYYDSEAPGEVYRLQIPLGGHHLEVHQAIAEAAAVAPPASRFRQWGRAAAVLLVAALGFAAAILWMENRDLKRRQLSRESLPAFWKTMLEGGRATNLVLPTPIFLYWEEQRLVVRDSKVNEFTRRDSSPLLTWITKSLGPPKLLQNYTVAADTVAAVKLSQYLERHGEHLWISAASELSLDSFGDRNIIFIGSPGTSDHLQNLLEGTNFYISPGTTGTVRSRRPNPGEPESFTESAQSDQRALVPGLVSLVPGKGRGTKLLLFSGKNPASLVSYLVSPGGLEEIERSWLGSGRPPFFEAVLMAVVDGNSLLKARLAAFRPIRSSPSLAP